MLGLTPRIVSAAPPDPASPIEQPEPPAEDAPELPTSAAPQVSLELISSARAIVVIATPLDQHGQPSGDAIQLGAPPLTTTLPAGRWRLDTRGRGYHAWSRELVLEPGVDQRVQVEPTLIEGALLELRAANSASEGATVELDGVELCSLPCNEVITPGRHALSITKRKLGPLRSSFDAAQADELVFDVELAPAPSRAPAVVVGTVALGSLATAVAFTVRSSKAARSLADDLDRRVQYDQDDRRIDNGRRDAVIASAMYGVTAAVAGLTLYYLLRPGGAASKAEKQRRSLAGNWQLGPSFDRHGGALTLTVGF